MWTLSTYIMHAYVYTCFGSNEAATWGLQQPINATNRAAYAGKTGHLMASHAGRSKHRNILPKFGISGGIEQFITGNLRSYMYGKIMTKCENCGNHKSLYIFSPIKTDLHENSC